MHRIAFALFGLTLGLAFPGPARANVSSAGRAHYPLLQSLIEKFPGDTTSKDFLIRLPAHVDPQPGSEVNFALGTQPTLLALVSEIEVLVNGRPISRLNLDGKNPADSTNSLIRVSAPVPVGALLGDWNRFTLHFLFRKIAEANQDVLKNSTWTVSQAGSQFIFVYQRVALFPELRRFPHSIAEEKLLHPSVSTPAQSAQQPVIQILIPPRWRDVHLRGCAVIVAKLGQLNYLSDNDLQLSPLENSNLQTNSASTILMGSTNDLATISLPQIITAKIGSLKSGQGLLAEVITGTVPAQQRRLIISGADDAGLERAILSLGDSKALTLLPPNPAVIEYDSEISPQVTLPQNPASNSRFFATSPLASLLGSQRENGLELNLGLQQLNRILLLHSNLQQTAFLLPRKATLPDVKLLLDLTLDLGKQLPSSTVLWPEACGFSKSSPPEAHRLNNRSVLVLAPVSEWINAVPSGTHLPLEARPNELGRVRIQGRSHPIGSFEPSLALMHVLDSPWSASEAVVMIGGWQEMPVATVKNLFREAVPAGKIFGNLCAIDLSGRIATYNTHRPMLESFAEVVQRYIPEGLNVEETNRRLSAQAQSQKDSAHMNRIISCVAGCSLLLLVAIRLLLLWEREWRRKRAIKFEKPLESAS